MNSDHDGQARQIYHIFINFIKIGIRATFLREIRTITLRTLSLRISVGTRLWIISAIFTIRFGILWALVYLSHQVASQVSVFKLEMLQF